MSLFYVAAVVSIAGAVLAVSRAHAVHALLYLVVSFFGVAVVLFQLGAPFAAALEVIVYAGAIVVLFLFVVMLLNLAPREVADEKRLLQPRAWIGPSLLAAVLLAELVAVLGGDGGAARTATAGGTAVPPRAVGAALLGPYVLAVELVAMLLLAGLAAASHIGRGDDSESEREEAP